MIEPILATILHIEVRRVFRKTMESEGLKVNVGAPWYWVGRFRKATAELGYQDIASKGLGESFEMTHFFKIKRSIDLNH